MRKQRTDLGSSRLYVKESGLKRTILRRRFGSTVAGRGSRTRPGMKNLKADLWIMRPAQFIGFSFIMIGVLDAFYCCRLRFEAFLASKPSALQMMTFESAIVQELVSTLR